MSEIWVDRAGYSEPDPKLVEARRADLPSSLSAPPESSARERSGLDGHATEAGGATADVGSAPNSAQDPTPLSIADRFAEKVAREFVRILREQLPAVPLYLTSEARLAGIEDDIVQLEKRMNEWGESHAHALEQEDT